MGIFTIILAIIVIMVLAARRINLGLAMLAGGLIVIVGAPLSLGEVSDAFILAFSNETTWTLMAAVVLIGILGHLLKTSQAMDIMLNSLLRLIGDPRWLTVVLTGMIGSLAVPGGAMMSAPIIDQLGDSTARSAEQKTAINIVYRHMWYPIFPILPGIILAASLAKIPVSKLALANLPALVVGFLVAWFLLLHRLPGKTKGKFSSKDVLLFLTSIMPLILIIVLYVVIGLNFVLAVLVGITWALFNFPREGDEPFTRRLLSTGLERLKSLKEGFRPQLILIVAGIMFFKELVFISGLINAFALTLVSKGIPMWFLIASLSLLVGLVTGHHEAAIGIAIPIFVPILPPETLIIGVALAYIGATVGYIISPLHLCIILTKEYFQANFKKSYSYIAPIFLLVFLVGLLTALFRGL